MNRVVHFEIPSDDPTRAGNFYSDVFGWKIQQWGTEEYWMISTGGDDTPGIDGGLMRRRDPAQPVVCTIDVPDLNECMAQVESHGGEIVVPRMPVPGVGWVAYFKDPDGNIFGLIQEDSKAE